MKLMIILLYCFHKQTSSPRPSKIPQRVRDERSNKSDKSEKMNSGKEQGSLSDSRKDKSGKRYGNITENFPTTVLQYLLNNKFIIS